LPWVVTEVSDDRCHLALNLDPDTGWPFLARLTQCIRVLADGVALRIEVDATGDAGFPAGAGWHPWFRRDVRLGCEPTVRVPAVSHYRSRPDLIPIGVVGQPDGDADLREGPELGSRRLDDFYGSVSEPMRITWGDLSLTMTSSANCAHAVVYTGSERGFCVEPQTCAPDAFNLNARGIADTGIAIVVPGKPLVAETTWRWSASAG
jgi:galactose mutarotase-like enzyme